MDPGQQVVGEVARPPRGHHPPSFPSFSSSSTFSLFALNPHPAFSPHSEKLWRAVLKLERVSTDDGGSFEVRWLLHHPLQRLVELPRRYSAASHSSHSTSSSSSPVQVHLFLSYFLIDTICNLHSRQKRCPYLLHLYCSCPPLNPSFIHISPFSSPSSSSFCDPLIMRSFQHYMNEG